VESASSKSSWHTFQTVPYLCHRHALLGTNL